MYSGLSGCGCAGAMPSLGADTIGWGTLPPACGPMLTVQQNLTKAGFPVAPTGKLDEATAYALVNFQIAHNIPNEATSEQICAYLAAVAAGLNPSGSSWGGPGTPSLPAQQGGQFLRPGWRAPSSAALTPSMQKPSTAIGPGGGAVMQSQGPGGTGTQQMSSTMKVLLVSGAALLIVGGFMIARKKR